MKRFALASLLLALAAGTLWQPHDPDAIDLARRYAEPSLRHLIGTDHLGRDVLSRLMVGGARSLAVIALVTLVGVGGGVMVGSGAALAGEGLGRVILRGAELTVVVPTLVLGLIAAALFGLHPVSTGLALGLAGIGPQALFVHHLVRRIAVRPYVLAARALGVGPWRLWRHHVIPALLPAVSTQVGSRAASGVVAFASLAFLGVGADPSQADWGSMLFEARSYGLDHPLLMLAPGGALAATAWALSYAFDP